MRAAASEGVSPACRRFGGRSACDERRETRMRVVAVVLVARESDVRVPVAAWTGGSA